MTVEIVVMIIIGLVFIFVSYFLSEKLTKKEDSKTLDLMAVKEEYEFSERELQIIRRKIEEVIANQAKDILYETNESLNHMSNEKQQALGDYAVAVCEQIEKNHKEVMFLYSMLDDKQKEIMNTVRTVDDMNREMKETLEKRKHAIVVSDGGDVKKKEDKKEETVHKSSAIDQLTALSKKKREMDVEQQGLEENSHMEPERQEVPRMDEVQSLEESEEKDTSDIPQDAVKEKRTEEELEDFQERLSEESMEDVFEELLDENIDFDDALEDEFEENGNSNDIILQMHKNGSSIIEIAKQLGLGVGEVKLVIDLYQGE